MTASLPWAQARELARGCVSPVTPREVPLPYALGTVLAQDARALSDLPATDTSAMDGWAVAGPGPWRVVGEVRAGEEPGPIEAGTALVIATGATMPAGADGVLRSERGLFVDELLNPADDDGAPAPVAGSALVGDVRRAGRECRRGEIVLPSGTRVGPPALGLLAAAGLDSVSVRRPTVDLLVLGDELLESGPARDGRLRDALGPMLTAWLPALGLSVVSRRRVSDRADSLTVALRGCLADVVVTTGSTARGPVDHLHQVLEDAGARLVVDGVQVRPGHPMLLAVLPDGRPVVGLPGNPLAAVSGLLTLLVPIVSALSGRAAVTEPRRVGPIAQDIVAGDDATRLVPVQDGHAVMFAGPAMLRGLAAADAVAVIPPGGVKAGDMVELLSLP